MILRPRSITAYLNDVLSAMPCAVIQGARQVGKSTLAGQIAAQTPSATFTMDDTDTREAALADPEWFLAQNSDRLIVIDEIQRAPELILPIKASIDRDRRPGRFLLTGSSDLLRVQGAPDSLAGRALTVHLHGFSQGERRGRVDDF
ncbi:MAG: ATP-binding protein, partial [Microbacterium gubbeenense]